MATLMTAMVHTALLRLSNTMHKPKQKDLIVTMSWHKPKLKPNQNTMVATGEATMHKPKQKDLVDQMSWHKPKLKPNQNTVATGMPLLRPKPLLMPKHIPMVTEEATDTLRPRPLLMPNNMAMDTPTTAR